MKIFLVQQDYTIGDFKGNTQKILEAIREAETLSADIAVFSEMCVCGYPAQDLLLSDDFLDQSRQCVDKIRDHTNKTAVIIGAPEKESDHTGKRIHNAAYFIHEQKIKHINREAMCLGTNNGQHPEDVFSGADGEIISFGTRRIKIAIGQEINLTHPEDIRNDGLFSSPDDQPGPDLLIHISATPFNYRNDKSIALKQLATERHVELIHCSCVGAQSDLILEGRSMVIGRDGSVICELPVFREEQKMVYLPETGSGENSGSDAHAAKKSVKKDLHFDPRLNIHLVREALVCGIRGYFSKTGFNTAVLGNSGGIDSAVSIALACEALGSNHVYSLLMPSPYSTTGSVKDGEELCKNLNTAYHIVPVKEVFESFKDTLHPLFGNKPEDVTEENLQARIRGSLLMSVANKFGHVLLNTSNKSELCVGYGTLYGDLAGGLSILGDCYKQQVYALAEDINKQKEIIPASIIRKKPSAELRPGQFDQESLPPYEILDQILFALIEGYADTDEICSLGFGREMVEGILSRVKKNEFKRHQFCPILRVSPRPFALRKMPVISK